MFKAGLRDKSWFAYAIPDNSNTQTPIWKTNIIGKIIDSKISAVAHKLELTSIDPEYRGGRLHEVCDEMKRVITKVTGEEK